MQSTAAESVVPAAGLDPSSARPDPGSARPDPGSCRATAPLGARPTARSVLATLGAAGALALAPSGSAGAVPAPEASRTGSPSALGQAVPGPSGVWRGNLEVQGESMEITVTLRESAAGDWTGEIDIPAQNLADYPLSDIAVAATTVTFAMQAVPGDPLFLATLDAEAGTLSGNLEQSGGVFPFMLERIGDAAAKEAPLIQGETAARVVGDWEGTLAAGGQNLRIVLHLEIADTGLAGTMDSPDQGQTGLPLSEIAFDGSRLRVDLTYAGAFFEGTLSEDGNAIDGAWNQGGAALPLRLERGSAH